MILENSWDDLAKLNFDIAVTYRFTPNLVPINEVLFTAEAKMREARNFSQNTYEHMRKSKTIKLSTILLARSRKVERGQLSLNGICNAGRMITYRDSTEDIVFLPCDKFNR